MSSPGNCFLRSNEHIHRLTDIAGRQERNSWQPVTHLPVIQLQAARNNQDRGEALLTRLARQRSTGQAESAFCRASITSIGKTAIRCEQRYVIRRLLNVTSQAMHTPPEVPPKRHRRRNIALAVVGAVILIIVVANTTSGHKHAPVPAATIKAAAHTSSPAALEPGARKFVRAIRAALTAHGDSNWPRTPSLPLSPRTSARSAATGAPRPM